MAFRRKLFTLLSVPRDGGGGGGLSENDVDFVIDLIERQNEIDKTLTEAERDREQDSGQSSGAGGKDSGGSDDDPCAQLRKQLSDALRDGNYVLAETVSRSYTRCLTKRKVLRKIEK